MAGFFMSCPRGTEEVELLRDIASKLRKTIQRLDRLEQIVTGSVVELGQQTLSAIKSNQEINMATFQQLADKVSHVSDVEDASATLIAGIVQQLKDAQAQNDPKAIDDLIAKLDAHTDPLAAAVAANTPAPPADTPPADTPPDAGTPST